MTHLNARSFVAGLEDGLKSLRSSRTIFSPLVPNIHIFWTVLHLRHNLSKSNEGHTYSGAHCKAFSKGPKCSPSMFGDASLSVKMASKRRFTSLSSSLTEDSTNLLFSLNLLVMPLTLQDSKRRGVVWGKWVETGGSNRCWAAEEDGMYRPDEVKGSDPLTALGLPESPKGTYLKS